MEQEGGSGVSIVYMQAWDELSDTLSQKEDGIK